MALEMTHSALALEDSADLRRREQRLRERAARPASKSTRLPLTPAL
jgi:hypothetical protein